MTPEERKAIKQEAIAVANSGEERAKCPHEPRSEEGKAWTAAYYGQLYQLSGEPTA